MSNDKAPQELLSKKIMREDFDISEASWRVDEAIERFDFNNRAQGGRRMDANETNFMQRQLLAIQARVHEVKYPRLIARQAFPMAPSLGAGLLSTGYEQLDYKGQFALLSSGATDSPEVASTQQEFTAKVGNYGAHYAYTHHELERAMRARVGLSERKAVAARQASEFKVEDIAFAGDTKKSGIKGLLSHSLSEATGLNGGWAAGSTQNVLDDIQALREKCIDVSSDALDDPDTLIISAAVWGVLTRYRTNTDSNLLELIRGMGFTRVFRTTRFDNVTNSTNSISASNIMACFKYDPMIMELDIPREFQQLPMQNVGLNYKTECLLDMVGLKVYHPTHVTFGKGL